MKYKVVILVLASRGEVFCEFREIWEKYCHRFPEVKTHFVYGQGEHENKYESDLIFEDCPEKYPVPVCKTIKAFEFVEANYDYDFLLRTNLSSFWIIPKFLENLKDYPSENFYSGDGPFELECRGQQYLYYSEKYFSGTDTVVNKKMITNSLNYLKEDSDFDFFLKYANPFVIPEDKAMGMLFDNVEHVKIPRGDKKCIIQQLLLHNSLEDVVKGKTKETDSSNKDNFRIKNGPKRQIDIKIMDFLYKHYYVN